MNTSTLALLAGSVLALPAVAEPGTDLRADAASRASFLAAAGGGYEKGAFFISDGTNNTLTPYGFVQFRYLLNIRDEDSVGDQDDLTHGFQMRRARMGFKGTIWDKNLSYDIVGEFSRSTGTFTLLDAFGNYKFNDHTSIKWGQFKAPLLREEGVSDTKQLAVERSNVNAVFTQGRSQGVQIAYATDEYRIMAALHDGLNTINTDFTASAEADFAVTARAEMRLGKGDFKRFEDLTSWKGSEYGCLLGLAAHYQSGGETGGTTDADIAQVTADVSVEGDGWNAFIAGVWRNTDAGGASTDDFGLVAQAGMFVSDQVEPFLRYDGVFADDANGEDFHTVAAGVNYYVSPQSHAAKFSADVLYYIDAEADSALVNSNTGANILADSEEGQIALRMQMLVMW